MSNLKFNSLKILSNPTKSANQFEFHPKLNLITAKENSVGKTTFVKLLFWAIGCEPFTDTTWQSQDCQTILCFSIADVEYQIMRHKESITLKDYAENKTSYHKITGEYSQKIAELLGFKALLTSRDNSNIETPPPAYYFIPFYIDQVKSWSEAWNNFDKLLQYENWKAIIIKYHVGLLQPEYFELEKEKFEKKVIQKELEAQIEKYTTALEVVASHTPEINTTLSEEKFEIMTSEIRKDLKFFSENQEKMLDELAKIQGEKSYLENQLIILKSCVSELDKDYVFAYENIDGELLECPLCATQHENNIFNKASILADKNKAENQLNEVTDSLNKLNKKHNSALKDLENTKKKIVEINDKYILQEVDSKIKLSDIIENIAGKSIKENVGKAKKDKLDSSSNIAKDITALSKKQKSILSEEQKENINKTFAFRFSKYVKALNATSVNTSQINSPLDYNKVVKEGGAAESTRAILAYYLSIFSLIENFGSEIIAPFVIDTPNQQEQSLGNYDKIIDLIFSEFSEKIQVFMCAMENSLLAPFAEKGKVFIINEHKLLHKSEYETVLKEFDKF